MDYKIKRKRKTLKTRYIIMIFLIILVCLSFSYSLFSTRLTINGTANGQQQQFSVIYLNLTDYQDYPTTIGYMSTYTNQFTGSPTIVSVSMGGTTLTLNTDYTYSQGLLTIPDVTGNIVIEGDAPSTTFDVTFDIDGATNVVQVNAGETVDRPEQDPVKAGYGFLGWLDENDDEFDFTTPIMSDITLHAGWVENRVAEINGTYYSTLQAAINAVSTNNTQTTIRLLTNVSENLSVAAGKNIVFDFQSYTISVSSGILLENKGTVSISNGILNSSSTNAAAINNESTGDLTISGGRISMTATGGKQAIYNNKGIVKISGSAYISSASPASGNNARATVQSLAGGTLTITGGTIVAVNYQGVNNAGTMTVGTEDGSSDKTSPIIQGATLGINSTVNYNFYDGTIKGKTNAVNDETKIANIETGYEIMNSSETINGNSYKIIYLSATGTVFNEVIFNPNGGTIAETTREVETGTEIGELPIPTWTGHLFTGWYTSADGGEEINANTIISADITYYAHWIVVKIAEVNGVQYDTLQAAINAVPKNNTQTTVKLLRDTSETVIISNVNQNVLLDLQNHTLRHKATASVIDNKGTVTITNGNIESSENSILNNQASGRAVIDGARLIGTGTKQVVYNFGTVEIKGNAYLSSRATGIPPDTSMGRATIQNISGGTVTIKSATVIGLMQQAISNEGTLIIGTKDGNISSSSPDIRGETYGIINAGTLNFYDGIIKGITGGISGNIDDQETNSQLVNGTELINSKTYITQHLQ